MGSLRNPNLFRTVIQQADTSECRESGDISKWPMSTDLDIEFDASSQLISIYSETYDVPINNARSYFCSNRLPLTNLYYRSLSCEDCLSDSFMTVRFPVWKNDWCYITSAYCPIHLKALKSPSILPSIENRILNCYLHTLQLERSPAKYEEKRLALLAVKAQSWMQSRAISHPLEAEALLSLYGLFLSRRTLHAVEGVAASGFAHPPRSPYRGQLDVQSRIDFGMHSANGAQRGGALFLIGWLLELFQTNDVNGAIRTNRMVRRALPQNARMLGYLTARIFMTREEGDLFAQKLRPLKDYGIRGMCEFLNALNASIKSLR